MSRVVNQCEGPRALGVRACAACRKRRPSADLIRFVADGGSVVPDLARRRQGRGLNLCPDRACLVQALRRRVFGRGLRDAVRVDQPKLCAALAAAAAGALEEAVRGALRSGDARAQDHARAGEPAYERARRAAQEMVRPDGSAILLPAVDIEPGAVADRVAFLSHVLSEFTFLDPGDINPRPAPGRGAGRSNTARERPGSQ